MIKSIAFAICMSLTLTAVADEKEVYNSFAVNMTGAGVR